MPALSLLLLVGVLLLPACAGSEPSEAEVRRQQIVKLAQDAGLSEDVQEFLGDAAEAVDASFTVTYREGDKTTTLTQQPPNRRIDVVAGDVTESLYRLRCGEFACTRQGDGPWDCKAVGYRAADPDLGVFSEDRLEATAKAIADARAAFDISIAERRVANVQARCLVSTPKTGGARPDELCIAATGAVLRVRTGDKTVEAERYSDDVPADAFDLAAEPR